MKVFIPLSGDILIFNQDFSIEFYFYEKRVKQTRQVNFKKGDKVKVNSLDARNGYNTIYFRIAGERQLIPVPFSKLNGIDCDVVHKTRYEIHTLTYPKTENRKYEYKMRSSSRSALLSRLRKRGSHRNIFKLEILPLLEAKEIFPPNSADFVWKGIGLGSQNDKGERQWEVQAAYDKAFDEELRNLKGITNWNQLLDHLPEGFKYEVEVIEK